MTETVRAGKGLDTVFTDGVLIDLDVTYWSGLRRNTRGDLGLEDATLPAFVVGLGTKRLIPKQYTDAWSSLAGRGRYLLERHAYKFTVANALFVPLRALVDVDAGLQQIKTEFEASVAAFLSNYDAIRLDMLATYPEHRDSLAAYYPVASEIAEHFTFEWGTFTVSVPIVEEKKRVALEALTGETERTLLVKYQRDLERKANGFLEEAVRTLRAETVALVTGVGNRIATGEVITEKSLGALRRHVDRFRTMNFVGDHEVETRLDGLNSLLASGASEFRTDEAARAALTDALSQVRKAAENVTDISEVTGTYRRRINLSDAPGAPASGGE